MLSLEDAVLGMIVSEPSSLPRALASGLTFEAFSSPKARKVFKAILEADRGGRSFDADALSRVMGTEDSLYVAQLLTEAPIAQNVEFYSQELINQAWQRTVSPMVRDLSIALAGRKEFDPIEPLLSRASEVLDSVAKIGNEAVLGTGTAEQVAGEFLSELIRMVETDGALAITTGIKSLDEAITGFIPGTYNVLGARTSVGKTAFAIHLAHSAAKAGKRVLYFTNEMTRPRIFRRFVSLAGRIDAKLLKNPKDMPEEVELRMHSAIQTLVNFELLINDKAMPQAESVLLECHRLHREKPLDFIVVDYLQQLRLPGVKGQPKNYEIGDISARLQEFGRKNNVAMLVLAQLNREAEDLPPEVPPSKHHLRDSGSIEQDADTILLLHRPSINNPTGFCQVIIAKARDDQTGFFPLKTDYRINQFADPDQSTPRSPLPPQQQRQTQTKRSAK